MPRPLPLLACLALLVLDLGLTAAPAAAAPAAAAPAATHEAPNCAPGTEPRFVLGFADLRAQVGEAMGAPVECENANPENGDSLQRTTTGLAFYRKRTNTPTFTDGWLHWALTPAGLVRWTGASVDPPAGAEPAGLAQVDQTQPGCFSVGARTCLRADPALAEAIKLLQGAASGPDLLRTAAETNVRVRLGTVPQGAWAYFAARPREREVVLASRLTSYTPRAGAAVLAHELQHATDWAQQGAALDSTTGCFSTEANAFRTQASVWTSVNGGRLPRPQNDLERQLSSIADAIRTDPDGFYRQLTRLYRHECGVAA